MNSSNSVNKNAVYNTVKTIFGIIYPLITFPYISRVLMTENVGKINFCNSVVSYFSLVASLGVTTYAIRECSRVRDNKEELNKTASQIFSINLFSTLVAYIALVVTLIFARPLDNYRLLICIQSSTILFTTLGADWINSAMEDFKFIAVRTVGMQIVSLVLMFIFIHNPDDYIKYAIISVEASSGTNIINIFYRRKYCKTRFTLDLNLKKHLPPILVLFSLILAQTIYVNSDMTILGLIRGDCEVGLYSTSVKVYNLVNQVVASIAFVVMPQLSANFAEKNYVEINKLLKYALNYIIVLGLPCLVGINVICKPIIYTIAGSEYLGASVSLHILTLALTCSFICGWIGNMTLIPTGRDKICLRISIISALANIVLNLLLIPSYGLNAAAFTTFVSELLGVLISARFIDKNIKIDGLFEMLKAPGIGSILIAAIGILYSHMLSSYYLITFLTIITSFIVYGLVLFILKNEFFMGYVAPVINKIKGVKNK